LAQQTEKIIQYYESKAAKEDLIELGRIHHTTTNMDIKDKVICASYVLIAVIALPATWINNIAFMTQSNNSSFMDFFQAAYVNAAAASLTNDLMLLAIAACMFMVLEGRRLSIRYYWLYVILSAAVAVSVTFPLFLLARHIKLLKEGSEEKISEAV
jgi:hypothetical protein